MDIALRLFNIAFGVLVILAHLNVSVMLNVHVCDTWLRAHCRAVNSRALLQCAGRTTLSILGHSHDDPH